MPFNYKKKYLKYKLKYLRLKGELRSEYHDGNMKDSTNSKNINREPLSDEDLEKLKPQVIKHR